MGLKSYNPNIVLEVKMLLTVCTVWLETETLIVESSSAQTMFNCTEKKSNKPVRIISNQ